MTALAEGGALIWLLAPAALLAVWLLRRPLRSAAGVALRGSVGLVLMWLFNLAAGWAGLATGLGVNLFNGLVLGVLGLPGFGLLLLWRALV